MKTENSILMRQARESLSGKWDVAVGAYALYLLINIILSRFNNAGTLAIIIVSGPMLLGAAMFSLAISRKENVKYTKIFDGFNSFVKSLMAYLLLMIFTLLWSLLLIVPGIIAAISYSQIFYILADNKSMSAEDAMERSKKMMYGYKWKYFCLRLRFIGWIILSFLTFGIGFLWALPYMQVTMAKFYDDLLKS